MLDPADIDARIADFKRRLAAADAATIVHRHILTGAVALLSDDEYFELRQTVANHFHLNAQDVFVVGSAKLGFSIAPGKRYRHFGNTSDLDLVIVSDTLFMTLWKRVHEYDQTGAYWPRDIGFKKYLFRGWIRPDMLPNERRFDDTQAWWEFFNGLNASGRFPAISIRCALYKEIHFIEAYQKVAVLECQRMTEGPDEN